MESRVYKIGLNWYRVAVSCFVILFYVILLSLCKFFAVSIVVRRQNEVLAM